MQYSEKAYGFSIFNLVHITKNRMYACSMLKNQSFHVRDKKFGILASSLFVVEYKWSWKLIVVT